MIDTKRIREIFDSSMSTSEIAILTGITTQNINKYRRGESDIRKMSFENAIKIDNLYDSMMDLGRLENKSELSSLEKVLAFDSLDNGIKSLLMTITIDPRQLDTKLLGYHLRYNKNSGFIYCQVHSGVGGGHPVYEFTETTAFVSLVRVYATVSAGTIVENVDLDRTPIEKVNLYDLYLPNQSNIKEIADKIIKVPEMTKTVFDMNYNRIGIG